jgi:aryl-alcohol dehydrogenase-like predicted oxidoreductase
MINSKSKLVLGTAQLGYHYGINNTTGQPTTDESFTILDRACEMGINTLDTAYAYGDAEEVIGKWLVARKKKDVFIITKFKPKAFEENPGILVVDVIDAQFQESLTRLNVDRVDGYMLHLPQYLNEDVAEGLRLIKEKGFADNVGVSIYDEAEALRAIDFGFDYIQIPYNALDQRLDRTDFFQRAKEKKVTVFARSPFLQGLLLMEPSNIPAHMAHATDAVARFQEIARRHGLTPYEAAFVFSYKHKGIAHIVFGLEKVAQLDEAFRTVDIAEKQTYEDFIKETRDAFQDINREIVNPSLWKK